MVTLDELGSVNPETVGRMLSGMVSYMDSNTSGDKNHDVIHQAAAICVAFLAVVKKSGQRPADMLVIAENLLERTSKMEENGKTLNGALNWMKNEMNRCMRMVPTR